MVITSVNLKWPAGAILALLGISPHKMIGKSIILTFIDTRYHSTPFEVGMVKPPFDAGRVEPHNAGQNGYRVDVSYRTQEGIYYALNFLSRLIKSRNVCCIEVGRYVSQRADRSNRYL